MSRLRLLLGPRSGSAPTPTPSPSPPAFLSALNISVPEGQQLNHLVESDQPVTISIRTLGQDVTSVDADDVEVAGMTLRWIGNGTQDYEDPDDTGTNNNYAFVLRATNTGTGLFTDALHTITVTDVAEGEAPTNVVPPSIAGLPIDGTALTLHVGEWTGNVTGFDVEVRTVEATPVVLLARQAVTGDTTGNITVAVGKSIELRVWAKNGAAETLATSASFGPMEAAGDTFVLGLAFSTTLQSLPSSPYPFTAIYGASVGAAIVNHQGSQIKTDALYPVDNPNAGMSALGFGFQGSITTAAISATNFANQKCKGRLSSNLSLSQSRLRIDLPGVGVYRIYMGLGVSSSVVSPAIGIWDGDGSSGGTSLHQIGPVSDLDNDITIIDAMGNQVALTAWQAAAGPGMGSYVEVTVGAGAFITLGKSSNGGAGVTHLNCIAIFKVNS